MSANQGATTPADFWAGEFGNQYLQRNQVDWRARIPFWKQIMERTGARSVYEKGCNAGWNLSAIKRAYPDVQVYGIDINRRALRQAEAAGLGQVGDTAPPTSMFELTFTAGVLIHIPPADLQDFMIDVVTHSQRWVLAVEYDAEKEEAVTYRGHTDRLWKRPYGQIYREMGLTLVDHGPASGFDQCTYWLMEKTG